MECVVAGNYAAIGFGPPAQREQARPAVPIHSASLCLVCEVRSRCVGGIAAEAGSAQLQRVLAGRRSLRILEVLYRPDEPFEHVYAVRTGALKSSVQGPDGEQVQSFHFPGELVGMDGLAGGRQRVTVTSLDDTQLCALRFASRSGPQPGARAFMARLWDMMSCAVVRERAHKALLATLAPRERVFAFVASVAARMGARGQGRLPPGLSGADMASYLEVPQEGIDAALHRGMPGQRGGAPH